MICRAGPEHRVLGDPYRFTCVVSDIGGTAHISAGCGVIDADTRRDIHEALAALGFVSYEYERRKSGLIHIVRRGG